MWRAGLFSHVPMRENFKVVITNVKNNYTWYLSAHPTEELAKQKLREYALSNDFVMLTESKAESYDGQCRLFIFYNRIYDPSKANVQHKETSK